MSQVLFEVDVSNIDQMYGITIIVSDSHNQSFKEEEVPYYLLVFEGQKSEIPPDDVAKQFMAAHSEAMTSVGLQGTLERDEFEALLEDSVELAGELMIRHGLNVLEFKDVDKDLVEALFEKTLEDDEPEPLILN